MREEGQRKKGREGERARVWVCPDGIEDPLRRYLLCSGLGMGPGCLHGVHHFNNVDWIPYYSVPRCSVMGTHTHLWCWICRPWPMAHGWKMHVPSGTGALVPLCFCACACACAGAYTRACASS
ncbi:hypothetical protein LZ30DRAFT_344763 [Colletotrichum cereale]|nr:hypothetical protein LZ30DRAFT_344763 [Colletotrichum cereale]